ncbi:MAG TPA: hypothetical protein PKM67_10255 [Kiritimatiellia bacterium]|mgnify:CR=1 FL=1|nr:hypothetical protein [Kiritimatiellia bacterium]HNR94731.1 hypothetical protein [Kiritimatiellia bacterium]HNS81826.1 hypothetical protein [Kiritimatiellia bacterium]
MNILLALLLILIPLGAAAETVYLTDNSSSFDLGVFDVNILADDIHLEHASIITNISTLMAIAGVQECGLWVFDSLNAAPLLYHSFTNITSLTDADMRLYSFSMNLPVPKDFFVGFSAQGDGWNANNSDIIKGATNVLLGVSSNSRTYYYGAVAGGQLTTEYPVANPAFFTIQIKEAPLRISAIHPGNEGIELSVTNFYPDSTNRLERSTDGGNWESVTNFIAGPTGAGWIDTNAAGHTLYRLRRE